MRPRWHFGWLLFAIVMAWAECLGDVPRLLSPHRVSATGYAIALMNMLAMIGLVFYALGLNGSRLFWRIFAPAYAIMLAAQLGSWLPPFMIATARMVRVSESSTWAAAGIVAVSMPLLAMTVYTTIACFRLGDWIGPTRRPVGERQSQLSLPL